MRKHNPENELVKREYLAWLRNAGGRNVATLDQVAAALHAFETFTRYGSFKAFRREQAISFKSHLAELVNAVTGKPLSKATLHSRLAALKAFFEWLSREPGYRKAVQYSDAAYFNLSANDARIATATREQPTPSLEQIIRVLETMPSATVVERRDRALVAFVILSGARDASVASVRLKHVGVSTGCVSHDAREVRTKRAKTFTTVFFPVGDLPRRIFSDWIEELQQVELFGPDDPVFASTLRGLDDQGHFCPAGLTRMHWTSAAPIRSIFRHAFQAAGLPYFPPHSFRRTLMRLAYDRNLTPRELKAWSQNLGHDSVLTSLVSYGGLSVEEQSRIMEGLGAEDGSDSDDLLALADLATRLARRRTA